MTYLTTVDFPGLTILMAEQNRNLKSNALWMGPYPNRFPEGNYQEKARCLFIDGHGEALGNKYLSSSEAKKKHYIPNNVKFE